MPEGLHTAMSLPDFADLIEYLTTLRQPENALTSNRGMPEIIEALAKPIAVRPFFSEELRFPHSFVHPLRAGSVHADSHSEQHLSGRAPNRQNLAAR